MPEGPSIVILRELIEALHLERQQIIAVSGNTKIDKQRMLNQQITSFKSWGKHFLIWFKGFSLRILAVKSGWLTQLSCQLLPQAPL